MVHLPLHSYFIHNGSIRPNAEFKPPHKTGGVYEVIRVVDGVPLFLEEHLGRFFNSARLSGTEIHFTQNDISQFLSALITENKVDEGNILLLCKKNLKAFFIKHKYPDESWYFTGVPCGILKAERTNPNAKVFQTSVRQMADELMNRDGWYEVLLVDHLENVTEGSRSNVFFVSENRLVTPPGHEVLLGITRQRTIQLAINEGIPFVERDVSLNDLPAMQAAFITGTSPKILPLNQIGNCRFNPLDNIVQQLRKAYDDLIVDYISGYKSL